MADFKPPFPDTKPPDFKPPVVGGGPSVGNQLPEPPRFQPVKPTNPIAKPPQPAHPISKPDHPMLKSIMEAKLAEVKERFDKLQKIGEVQNYMEGKNYTLREKAECLAKIQAHVEAFGGESNIGMADDYWALLGEYRAMQ